MQVLLPLAEPGKLFMPVYSLFAKLSLLTAALSYKMLSIIIISLPPHTFFHLSLREKENRNIFQNAELFL